LLRADSQSSKQLQLSTQQQHQQQYNMLLSCSADTAAAAAALQWLELQTEHPAAAAADLPDLSMGIEGSGQLSLLLAAAARQLSLNSNAFLSVPAVTDADVLQVGSYSSAASRVDRSNSMLASQTWLAGQVTLAAAASGLQPQPQPYLFGSTGMPPAFPSAFPSAETSSMIGFGSNLTGTVGFPASTSDSWSNQMLMGSAGSIGSGVTALAGGTNDLSGAAGVQASWYGMHAF
jgi:hypothetical protein